MQRSFSEYEHKLAPLIRKYREMNQLSRPQLAKRMGFAGRTDVLGAYETGGREPHLTMVFKLAETFGYDFVNDFADELWRAAQQGYVKRRDEVLAAAQGLQTESQKQRERLRA